VGRSRQHLEIPLSRLRRAWPRAVLLASSLSAGALSAGCGDPLVGVDYSGTPLLSFEGQIRTIDDLPASSAPLRLSVFYSPQGRTDAPAAALVEDRTVSVAVGFPSTFRVNVFQPPPASWLVEGSGFAIASILVYEDTDRAGHFVPGRSRVLGGSLDRAVLYAPAPLPAKQSPTDAPLSAGMALVVLPQPCGATLDYTEGSEDCGVPLGAACKQDSDCMPSHPSNQT